MKEKEKNNMQNNNNTQTLDRESLKDSLLSKYNSILKEYNELAKTIESNKNNLDNIERTLKIKLGFVTFKASFLEAQMFTILQIISNNLGYDLSTLLEESQLSHYYIMNNHVLDNLKIKGDKIEVNSQIEDFLKTIKPNGSN
jgi:predicted permease